MSKALLLIALCVLPAVVVMAARPNKAEKKTLVVRGRVYCDTCRAGFETPLSTYIAGATVKVECKDRKTMEVVYTSDAKTDKEGYYQIFVHEDHKDQQCDALLVESSQPDCAKISPGRERARVSLTNFNGIASQNRYANNMGFEKEEADAGCEQVMQQYQMFDEVSN